MECCTFTGFADRAGWTVQYLRIVAHAEKDFPVPVDRVGNAPIFTVKSVDQFLKRYRARHPKAPAPNVASHKPLNIADSIVLPITRSLAVGRR